MKQTVFLFDLDGVLVRPLGYRRAIQSTLEYFTTRMGFGDLYPGEDIIAIFESQGITGEWDIIPICLISILDAIQATIPEYPLPEDLLHACDFVMDHSKSLPTINYRDKIIRLGSARIPGTTYSTCALQLSQPGVTDPLFPSLVGHPLLSQAFEYTRSVQTGLTTQIFQQYALGSKVFEQTYHIRPTIQTISYLQNFDNPLLDPEWGIKLLNLYQGGQIALAAFTARPSSVSAGNHNGNLPYSPEAEMVLEKVGLSGIPLVGYGQVVYLAEQLGMPPETFVKPSPVQALGAIATAINNRPQESMDWAYEFYIGKNLNYLDNFQNLDIHVFEDSLGGIQAVQDAAKLIRAYGRLATVHSWGIATNPDKVARLTDFGAHIVPSVNDAIPLAIQEAIG